MVTKQQILDRLDIPQLVRELRPDGTITGQEYLCLCPFHDDHHPSLSINEQKLGTFIKKTIRKGNEI